MIGESYKIMAGNGDVYSSHTPAKTEEEFNKRWNILKDMCLVTFSNYEAKRKNAIIESFIGQPCSIKWGRHLMIQVSGRKIETSPIVSIKNSDESFEFETEDGKIYTFLKKEW